MWVSVHQSIDGEKLEKLREKLNCSKFEVVGILVLLWLWGKENAENNGVIDHSCLNDIEGVIRSHIVGCKKKPSEIVTALMETGWLDVKRGVPQIHDWEEWQPVSDDISQLTIVGEEVPVDNKRRKRNDYSNDFDAFWKVYPRRVEKIKAYKSYLARINEGHTPEQMLCAAQNYACICKRKGTKEEYIKHPATFVGPNKPFLDYLNSVSNNDEDEVLPFMK